MRKQKLVLGSVKSSIGHLEAGAALASIIKTVECLEHGQIPPQNHFSNPNPNIDFSELEIPTTLLQWPEDDGPSRRAAINSFGFGGSNAHMVLEHRPRLHTPPAINNRPYVFKVSASSTPSLYELSRRYAQYVVSSEPDLCCLAHTTLARRSTLAKTQYIVASSHEELTSELRDCTMRPIWMKAHQCDPLGFIFTGQGAQW